MSHKLTREQELEMVKYRSLGASYERLCFLYNHGKTQVARTFSQENLTDLLWEEMQKNRTLRVQNSNLKEQKRKNIKVFWLMSYLYIVVLYAIIVFF